MDTVERSRCSDRCWDREKFPGALESDGCVDVRYRAMHG